MKMKTLICFLKEQWNGQGFSFASSLFFVFLVLFCKRNLSRTGGCNVQGYQKPLKAPMYKKEKKKLPIHQKEKSPKVLITNHMLKPMEQTNYL